MKKWIPLSIAVLVLLVAVRACNSEDEQPKPIQQITPAPVVQQPEPVIQQAPGQPPVIIQQAPAQQAPAQQSHDSGLMPFLGGAMLGHALSNNTRVIERTRTVPAPIYRPAPVIKRPPISKPVIRTVSRPVFKSSFSRSRGRR